MKIKICGLTMLQDVILAKDLGAWALGFNFYKKSPRYIQPDVALELIVALKGSGVIAVGIFIEENYLQIKKVMLYLGLDFAQIYRDIDCPTEEKKSMILAIKATAEEELPGDEILQNYAYVLLDAPFDDSGLYGGTGKCANWNLAKNVATRHKLILAGGLNMENIMDAVQEVSPFAVDVASGVEIGPGKKDARKLKNFFDCF